MLLKERQSEISIIQPCKQIVEWYIFVSLWWFCWIDRHCKCIFLLSLSLDWINIISSPYLDSWSNECSRRSLAEKPANFTGYWLLYTTLHSFNCLDSIWFSRSKSAKGWSTGCKIFWFFFLPVVCWYCVSFPWVSEVEMEMAVTKTNCMYTASSKVVQETSSSWLAIISF